MKTLKRIAVFIAVALLAACSQKTATQRIAENMAQMAVEQWLALVDAGEYGQSWDASAAIFQGAVTKQQWEDMLEGVRKPLGALESRKLKSATHMTQMPGAPDGEYVVLQFESSFANKKKAIETVTPMREQDGSWKVSGYWIK